MTLSSPVSGLKGVGARVEEKLTKLGIATLEDLIHHYPRRYEDFSKITSIRSVRPGPVTVRGRIERVAARRAVRKRLHITEAIITDGTGTIKAVWFNQPYLAKSLPTGTDVFVSGKLEFRNNDLALQAPAVELVGEGNQNTARIVPVYPETDGLSSRQLRTLIAPLLPELALHETLPPEVVKAGKLMDRSQALREIHFPSTAAKLKAARHRLAFEELFSLILTSLVIKQEIKTEKAPKITTKVDIAKELIALLGFDLTNAQRKTAWQILQDMDGDVPMNRLLEGDVGSGKTVVAALAAVMANANNFQAALMVPTEILARQHQAKLMPLFHQMGFCVDVLLGGQTAAQKSEIRAQLAAGKIDLIIGTHALLSEEVTFKNLGLVVIDEQHRFGVAQRTTLKAKAGRLPHLLSMTATPIPRSLALTVYGDLDISIIGELPPGRKSIATRVIPPDQREEVYELIDEQISSGRQVFVVCPLIEESDKLGAKSAVVEANRLKAGIFKHRRIGLLHGKMPAAEKQAVMAEFAGGNLDILVATSVIEVGIDVPNATIMLIEGAERFGLAALHQLRGRIGRGKHQSYCFLQSEDAGEVAMERLAALERTQDGFRLAQIDMELRGPGQIYGTRQHGILDLEIADLSDSRLVAAVRTIAADYLSANSGVINYEHTRKRVNRLKAVTSLD